MEQQSTLNNWGFKDPLENVDKKKLKRGLLCNSQ